jgi:hypothetical protein
MIVTCHTNLPFAASAAVLLLLLCITSFAVPLPAFLLSPGIIHVSLPGCQPAVAHNISTSVLQPHQLRP